ncbi:MAG: glycosyltransferase family 1 protein [Pseudomonadota bacterium]
MPYAATEPHTRPRVAYFANQFAEARGHGLNRYSHELFNALRADDRADIVPVAGWSSLDHAALCSLRARTGLRLTGLGRRGTSLLWTFADRPTLERCVGQDIDVVHAVSLGYPIATRKPLVVTIHDLGPLTQPEFFANTRPWVMERSLKQTVTQADAIVCVSRSTANEVLDYCGSHIEDRVRVVTEGVSREFFDEVATDSAWQELRLPPGTPFILSAGSISPRKNIVGLLDAFDRASSEIPHHLVIVGGVGWSADEVKRRLEDPTFKDRVHLPGFVSNEILRALYRAAAVYVHPSLYEGFGLPVLEAMASGTPVIASNRTSLPEVAGDAGRMTDTANTEAFASAILAVCQSEELQHEMIEKGLAQSKRFTWDDCADAMAHIYAEVAGR